MSDEVVVDAWWRHFVRTGDVPDELKPVQGRLIRAVHRGALPSGEVFVKTMTFPRVKDRLRYALRALPARHEAAMLQATALAGLPCPEVVAVRTQRRLGLPHRSMLVLRGLGAVERSRADTEVERRVRDEVTLAQRLLAAGIRHRDLHSDNFVRTRSGELAVLDLQSANRARPSSLRRAEVRLDVAARLLRDLSAPWRAIALDEMHRVGLLDHGGDGHSERDAAVARADRDVRRHRNARVRRCLGSSTEFERRLRWTGVEYRRRGSLPEGRWWSAGRSLRRAWIGQRQRQLAEGAPLSFAAFFAKWWWLGGGEALYVPVTWSDERIEAEVRAASVAIDR